MVRLQPFTCGQNRTESTQLRQAQIKGKLTVAQNDYAEPIHVVSHRQDPERNYGQVIEEAAALAAEGLDLGIVYVSPPHDAAVVEPLAEAIRDSGLWT